MALKTTGRKACREWIRISKKRYVSLIEHVKPRRREKRSACLVQKFRSFGNAVAWIECNDNEIKLLKIESLKRGENAASKLLSRVKLISQELDLAIIGNAVPYSPIFEGQFETPPVVPLTQSQLVEWYKRHGFSVMDEKGFAFLRFPASGLKTTSL